MVRQLLLALALFCTVIFCSAEIRAERLWEKPEGATHVVMGTIQSVFARETEVQMQFILEIKVPEVERPGRLTPGNVLQVICFQKKEFKVAPDATFAQKMETKLASIHEGGHSAVPKDGQPIRARDKPRHGRLEVLCPDWFTVDIQERVPILCGKTNS